MSEQNGKTVVVPAQQPDDQDDRERFRPKAGRDKVYAEIERGLRSMVSEAAFQAGQFVSLSYYERDAEITARHGHLVDASECMELAMTYLGQLKQLLSHRIRVDHPEQRF
jgi:hypothetical protein